MVVAVVAVVLTALLAWLWWGDAAKRRATLRPFEPHARAFRASLETRAATRSLLESAGSEPTAQPVDAAQWPDAPVTGLEGRLLEGVHGRVLDVGAGAGRHTLALQRRGVDVVAIDSEPLMVEVMRAAGVRDVRLADFATFEDADGFDSVLFFGHGLGIAGSIARFDRFVDRLRRIVRPGARVYLSSHGPADMPLAQVHETPRRLRYEDAVGAPFEWFWVGRTAFEQLVAATGLVIVAIHEDGNNITAVVEVR